MPGALLECLQSKGRPASQIPFAACAIRHHWGLALLALAATAALSAAAAKVFPGTWHVEVRILLQPDPVTASLANPGRMMPSDPRAQLAAAAELLTSRENLLSLVQKTQLLKRWHESRAPLPALKDLIV